MESWASILIGIIGGFICFGASRALVFLKIDDPLDAFPVHGACGAWGCIAVGLFCTSDYTYNTKGHEGMFYGGGELLGVQLLGVLTEALWVGGTTAILFFSLAMMGGSPIGSLLMGLLIDQVGVHMATLFPVIGMIITALFLVVRLPLWGIQSASVN